LSSVDGGNLGGGVLEPGVLDQHGDCALAKIRCIAGLWSDSSGDWKCQPVGLMEIGRMRENTSRMHWLAVAASFFLSSDRDDVRDYSF
jgi:hypothetical protein